MIFEYYTSSSAPTEFIFVICLLQPHFNVRLCLLELSEWWERKKRKMVFMGKHTYISSVKWKHRQCNVCVGSSCSIHSQFICASLYNSPLPPHPYNAGPSRDYPLPCLSEAGRGSQHGVFQLALPGPAPTASQALLFRLAQRGLLYWTRGQFVLAALPRQNDFC